MSALEDRRQRALDLYDTGTGLASQRVEQAIETATRVKITDEAIDCVQYAGDFRDGLAAALAELGFEVEV